MKENEKRFIEFNQNYLFNTLREDAPPTIILDIKNVKIIFIRCCENPPEVHLIPLLQISFTPIPQFPLSLP